MTEQVMMPSDEPESHVEFLWMDNGIHGECPVVVGFRGGCTVESIIEIEHSLLDEPEIWEEVFKYGAGSYLFVLNWIEEEIDYSMDAPRVAFPGYWDLTFKDHKPLLENQ